MIFTKRYTDIVLTCCVGLSLWLAHYIPAEVFAKILSPLLFTVSVTICFWGAFLIFRHTEGLRARKFWGYTLLFWYGNSYNSADWTKMESAGCVFLPATGSRDGSSVNYPGWYWSATSSGTISAYYVSFIPGSLEPAYSYNRSSGFSVRLVREVAGS